MNDVSRSVCPHVIENVVFSGHFWIPHQILQKPQSYEHGSWYDSHFVLLQVAVLQLIDKTKKKQHLGLRGIMYKAWCVHLFNGYFSSISMCVFETHPALNMCSNDSLGELKAGPRSHWLAVGAVCLFILPKTFCWSDQWHNECSLFSHLPFYCIKSKCKCHSWCQLFKSL